MLRSTVPGLAVIYLFGSQVRGGVHEDSDIDVAILSAEPLLPTLRFEMQAELSVRLRSDVDVVDLRSASTVMRMQVVATGSVLYGEESEIRQRFEMQTLSAYALLNEERAAILDHVHRRGRIYGR